MRSEALDDSTRTPQAHEFLQQLEHLSYSDRWGQVVEKGRTARSIGEGCAEHQLLLELSYSNVAYERRVGAMGLLLSCGAADVLRLVKDPCKRVASLAITPAARMLSDDAVLRLFEELPLLHLDALCYRLEQAKRAPGLVDRYLATVPSVSKGSAAAMLLSWASETYLATQPAVTLHLLDIHRWRTLTKRCPAFVASFVKKKLQSEGASTCDPSWVHAVLFVLWHGHPSIGLQLLAVVLEHISIHDECLLTYARMFPLDVAELLIRHRRRYVLKGRRLMRKLSYSKLIELFDIDVLCYYSFENFFLQSPSKLRSLLYEKHRMRLLESDGSMCVKVVARITDRKERESEALRALTEIKGLRANPQRWANYLAFLPFRSAVELGEQHLRNKDVNVRAAACGSVVKSARYHREHLDDILDFCVARRNECCVVRCSILRELSSLRSDIWEDRHQGKLAEILKGVCEAKDTSSAAASMSLKLIVKTIHVSTALLDAFMAQLFRFGGQMPRFSKSSPNTTVGCLLKHLLPWMKQQSEEAKENPLSDVVNSFGECLRNFHEEAVPFLWSLCSSINTDIMRLGGTLLFKYFRTESLRLLPDLLSASADWIHFGFVKNALCNQIQGRVLEQYLVPVKLEGRFERASHPQLIVFHSCHRWTAAQQQRYADSIVQCLKKGEQTLRLEEGLLFRLASLYSVNVTKLLIPFLAENYQNVVLRDRAIGLLGCLDDAASLQELISALHDKRDRVAICAIRQRLRWFPPVQVIEILKKCVDSKKVAVQKVALSIIGATCNEAAYVFLMEQRKGKTLHVDVEVAWLQAMSHFLEKEEAWSFFHDAAASTKSAVAMTVISLPSTALTKEWQDISLSRLFTTLLKHTDPDVVVKTLERLSKWPLRCCEDEFVEQLFDIILNRSEDVFVEPALSAITSSSVEPSLIASRIASVKEDLRLKKIVEMLSWSHSISMERLKSIVDVLVDTLLQSGRQPSLACQLMCEAHEEKIGELLDSAFQKGLLHPGAVASLLPNQTSNYDNVNAMTALERRLRQHESPYMQRIGLAVLCGLASTTGWDGAKRAALEVYRSASDRWVSDDAKLVSPSPY